MCVCPACEYGTTTQGPHSLGALKLLELVPGGSAVVARQGRRPEAKFWARELLLQRGLVSGGRPTRCPASSVAPPSSLRMLVAPLHPEDHFKFQCRQTSLESCLWHPTMATE